MRSKVVSLLSLSSVESSHCPDDLSIDSALTATDPSEKIGYASKLNNNYRSEQRKARIPTAIGRPITRSPLDRNAQTQSSRIRSRYFAKLGVTGMNRPEMSQKKMPQTVLKDCADQDTSLAKNLKNTDEAVTKNSLTPTVKPSVSFEVSVSVLLIPNRSDYADRDAIWIHRKEYRESAARNHMEFAADGWDWRKATEERDFIYCQNKLVHPAHFAHRECNLQRQFLKIMSAQRCSR